MIKENLNEQILKYYTYEKVNKFYEVMNDDLKNHLKNNEYYRQDISSYVNDTDLKLQLKSKFTIFSTNIESLNAKFNNAILPFVKEHKIDCLCFQECWLNGKSSDTLLNMEGYHSIMASSKVGLKGGLAIYVSNKINYSFIDIDISTLNWECLAIILNSHIMAKNIVLINIYRKPTNENQSIEQFIKELNQVLDCVEERYKNTEIILLGDFNIDLLKINDKKSTETYCINLLNQCFTPLINYPTRFTETSATLIDNIFVKSYSNIKYEARIMVSKMSDHQPCILTISNIKMQQSDNYKNCYKEKININEFVSRINALDFDDMLFSKDINENYGKFIEAIERCKSSSTKKVMRTRKEPKYPWITRDLLRSINHKNSMYKRLMKMDKSSKNYFKVKCKFKSYDAELKGKLWKSKLEYYNKKFENNRKNLKQTWNSINYILGRTNKSKEIAMIRINDKEINHKPTISKEFNNYFTSIGKNLAKEIKYSGSKNYLNALTKDVNSIFQFKPISRTEIINIIKKMEGKSSCGYDNISTKLIKPINHLIAEPLSTLINESLKTGIFPDQLKIAKMLPIYKKNDRTLLSNYRPISLLPCFSKIYERVVFNQLYEYFEKNKLLYHGQYGFRRKHNTELALEELIDKTLKDMNENLIPISIFIDLSKAFDTIDHKILLDKLHYYGIRKTELLFFESYLTNRKQYVDLNGIKSERNDIDTGVPQGSILGPLLFIIFLNDMPLVSENLSYILFADDTTLSAKVHKKSIKEDVDKINTGLEKVNEWLKINKLSINAEKSKYMIFNTRNEQKRNIKIQINETIIESVSNFSFLGITINESLNWNNQVNNVVMNISRINGILNKLKNVLPKQILKTLYNSLIIPHLMYGLLVWGYKAEKVSKIQRQSIRIISKCKNKFDHTEPLFKELYVLKFEQIFILKVIQFFYSYRRQCLPKYFLENMNLESIKHFHSYNTRHKEDLYVHHQIKYKSRSCLKDVIPKIINNLDQDILRSLEYKNEKVIKENIKNMYISNYKANCTISQCYVCRRKHHSER